MPRATVEGDGNSAFGEMPEVLSRLYGVGRSGWTVQVLGEQQDDGRIFVRVCNGPSAECTYNLPSHELYVPDVQPCIDLDTVEPFDMTVELPDLPTCPHVLASNRETVYDRALGLWVHAVASCRRPQASHLRSVAGADGLDW